MSMSNDPSIETSVGRTSDESMSSRPKIDTQLAFGLYDLTALFSLIFVTAATFLLFLELNHYGNVFTFNWPWSVAGERAVPVVPPAE